MRCKGGNVPLMLQSRRAGDIVVTRCIGRIVEGTESATLQQHVTDLLPDNPYIVLDLGKVEFIDSGGLGCLVRLLNRTRAAHGDLKLSAAPPAIRQVLRITRLGAIFDSHETDAEGITAFYERATPRDPSDRRVRPDVLCVEESADVLAYVCGVLKQAGYGVTSSDNLADALVIMKAVRPKLVVIGAGLRAARSTWSAETFNRIADALPLIELPADFSCREAGQAGYRLLDQVRAAIGALDIPPHMGSSALGP